jgi:uncharacterized protein YciI
MRSATILFTLTCVLPVAAQNPLTTQLKSFYSNTQRNLQEAVDKVPEGYLDFRPTAEVMTFRDVVTHLLDVNNRMCAAMLGTPAPAKPAGATKAELSAAVKASGELCDKAFAAATDANAGDKIMLGTRERDKAFAEVEAAWHSALHYGNLITYMRLRGMVPPETERAQQGQNPAAAPAKPVMVTYYLGFLKRGPKWTAEATPEVMEIQKGHMAHMRKSADSGILILAGPIADSGDLRGILIYKAKSMDEAMAVASQDPAVLAGRLAVEMHPWMVEKGYLP